MTRKCNISLITILVLLILACKAHKVVVHGTQEYISLKLIDQRYRYLYYNLSDTGFVYNFNTGRYIRDNDTYRLYPDNIQPDSYEVTVSKKHNTKIGDKIRIQITTDLTGDYSNRYIIHILNESSNVIFHGTKADTTISGLHLKQFRIKVDLANKFAKGMGNQLPKFTSITSNDVVVGPSENDISIHIPVSFATYFYKYQKEIDLKDAGLYWEINGRKVQMRNVDF